MKVVMSIYVQGRSSYQLKEDVELLDIAAKYDYKVLTVFGAL